MSKHFTHLHLHTDYSLLDGAISLDRLVNFGTKNNLQALAITDHGNIFGAVKFFQKSKKAGIKPVLGIEAYLTEDANIKDASNKYYHIILLVQNEIGYKNLCKLISFSYQKGFYFKPRIDYNILAQHSEGLIATSACLGGHIPQLFKHNKMDELNNRLEWFMKHFDNERFYLEVQPTDQQEQQPLNDFLFDLAQKRSLPLVATGDCHYVDKQDHEAHEVMLSVQTHGQLSDPNRYSFGDCRVYMRTQQEMLDLFGTHESAIWNTGEIADKCNFDFVTDKLFFPKCEIPKKHTSESYFKELCQQGLEELFTKKLIDQDKRELYQDRLDLEVNLITTMGFVEYFLIVSDFIKWAHRQGIPVGPGRGSAAGSLVSWTLEITNVDPIKYNLLFERFLNPERVSMPDIDIDFCIEGRDKVIQYVRDKYGHDKVCHIITFGTMMAKGVLKDVARVLGFPFEDSNALTSLIPDQLKISLTESLKQEPKLQEMVDNNPRIKKLFNIALKLEGLTRHASKHAAGIVISPKPIDEVLPLYIPSKSKELVAQYAMTELESIGFLKIDFLGLKNLTIIDRTLQQVKKNHNVTININTIPLDDKKTLNLIARGQTSGIFQLESNGLKEILRKLKPNSFEDVIAVIALYRPGPLGSGMVDDFIERKHGKQKITYIFDELEPILKETYGVIVYQEQVMKIASAIAGYSLGESDILRRAMGKKKVEVMQEQSKLFVQRATKFNFNPKKAQELFDLMAYFAGYGFNKSHSTAYAIITYQTSFLKAHYPAEFMASLISMETNNTEKMAFYLKEAKDLELNLLPPNINTSEINFAAHEKNILFGLQGIKNVGNIALENIVKEREKKSFIDLFDFCKRIDLRTANKRVIENLIYAGAFDTMTGSRAQQHDELATIMDHAIRYKKDKQTGQMGLFSLAGTANDGNDDFFAFSSQAKWSDKETLEKEKEVIGFYLSSHPLESYRAHIKRFGIQGISSIAEHLEQPVKNNGFVIAGMMTSKREITTKKGDRMAFVALEDLTGEAEIIVFPRLFAKVQEWLSDYNVFVVQGDLDAAQTKKVKIKAQEMIPLDLCPEHWKTIKRATITLSDSFKEEPLATFAQEITKGSLNLYFGLQENEQNILIKTKQKINLDKEQSDNLAQKLKATIKFSS